ncbi:MAG: 50S ribosome-binding GTPase [Actinomycetaceae bacterium]|nr:50S ribosome-binding GTPase [Actinomycetaceae bacterium]
MRLFNRLSNEPVGERVDRLRHVLELVEDDLPQALISNVRDTVKTADERLSLNPEVAVVAFIGATGSGKSSLFNALLGADIAQVGLRRPTTKSALAASAPGTDMTDLLDWLGIKNRVLIPQDRLMPENVTIVDLPDIDSVDLDNRALADHLAERVDILVWVVDPQKYADDVLHSQFIRPLAHHSKVTVVVLSQVDRLSPSERSLVMADLKRLVEEDGISQPRMVATSSVTGEGLEKLRDEIGAVARIQLEEAERLKADVSSAMTDIERALSDDGELTVGRFNEKSITPRLLEAATRAAGVPTIHEAVRRAYIHRGAQAVGWLPTRKLRMIKTDPLRRLHLGTQSTEVVNSVDVSPASVTTLNSSLRELNEAIGRDRPRIWKESLREVALTAAGQLPDKLNRAVSRTDLGIRAQKSTWWRVANTIQWIGWLSALIGGAWLAALLLARQFLLINVAPPMWRALPIPTWLLVVGLAWTVITAMLSYGLVRLVSRRVARRATAALTESIHHVVIEDLWLPLKTEDERQRTVVELIRGAQSRNQ